MESDSPYKSPEAEIAGGTVDNADLTRAFLGPKNATYYLKKFEQFEGGGGTITWHWPALFVTWIWFGYRKMWAWFLIYGFLYPFIVWGVAFALAFAEPLLAYLVYFAGYFVLPPMFANKLYYGSAMKKMARARLAGTDMHSQELEAARLGGTSNVALVMVPIVLVFLIGVIAAISIPAYNDYTARAQVSEGLNLAGGAKAAVTGYIKDTGTVPADNATAGIAAANEIYGQYTQSVEVNQGEITITFGNRAHAAISGKELFMVPSESDGRVEWSCASTDIAPKHLPAACR